jgi:hypothetical protein
MKPRKPFLIIRFTNGSDEQRRFHSTYAARLFARHHVSYSGGRVASVHLSDEYGHESQLWSSDWDAVSQYHGLVIPC